MSSENSATVPQDASATKAADVPVQAKGKGKAATAEEPVDTAMDEDDDEDEDDEDEAEGGDDDDNMDEIDLSNIVEGGRRTRGRVIDWAKAAEENPAEDDDDEDEDDYEPAAVEDQGDKMDED
ncbi:histone chaperone domain CHZ-domain-containing protein [Hypoxylon cercidicola]|nr:histone chaperone domain CHZ-domain-containing protein [Hypoxylon cercidicola]